MTPTFKLTQFDMRTLDTNVVLQHLEELIKLREMPVEAHLKKALKR